MSHIHSWRRLKKDKFYCTGTTCYTKISLDNLHGKFAKCTECNSTFLVNAPSVEDQNAITCLNCQGKETLLTVEAQEAIIKEHIESEIQSAYWQKFDELGKKEANLIVREKNLGKKAKELQQIEFKLNRLEVKLKRKEENRKKLILRYRDSLSQKRRQLEQEMLSFYKRSKQIDEKETKKIEDETIKDLKDTILDIVRGQI